MSPMTHTGYPYPYYSLDVRCDVVVTDGLGNWSDASREYIAWIWPQIWQNPSIHIEIPCKCKTYLLEWGDATRSSWEIVQACQTCTKACMALQTTQIQLVTHRNTSVHAQQMWNHWTHLLRAQGHVQICWMDLGPMQAHRGHAYTCIVMQTAWIYLKTCQKTQTYVRGGELCMNHPVRLRSQMNMLDMHTYMPSIANDLNIPENVSGSMRNPHSKSNTPYSPARSANLHTERTYSIQINVITTAKTWKPSAYPQTSKIIKLTYWLA